MGSAGPCEAGTGGRRPSLAGVAGPAERRAREPLAGRLQMRTALASPPGAGGPGRSRRRR